MRRRGHTGLAKADNAAFALDMPRISTDRALWLARMVLPHEPALRSWLRANRVADLEVDDVVQETYARLAGLESVDEIRDPKNYAFQVAHSIIALHVRRARIVSIRASADIERLGIASEDVSVERQLEVRDELRELAQAIAAMPDPVRKTFATRRIEGLSQRDTAIKLGITQKVVEHHMSRAIHLLMDRFGRGGKQAPRASEHPKKPQNLSDDRTNEQSN